MNRRKQPHQVASSPQPGRKGRGGDLLTGLSVMVLLGLILMFVLEPEGEVLPLTLAILGIVTAVFGGWLKRRHVWKPLKRLAEVLATFSEEMTGPVGELSKPAPEKPLSQVQEQVLLHRVEHLQTLLRQRQRKLDDEDARLRTLAGEASRFYSHARMLNTEGFHLDFFEYYPCEDRITFFTGMPALFGEGSLIFREMSATECFQMFTWMRVRSDDRLCEVVHLEGEPENTGYHEFREEMRRSLALGVPFSLEYRVGREGMGPLWLRCWGRPMMERKCLEGAFLDISHEIADREADRNRILTDNMTGFYNRNGLAEVAGRLMKEHSQTGEVVFVYFGLRHYAEFESRFGMVAGNHYIRVFADLLREQLGTRQVLFRWWGSDFLCIVRSDGNVEAVREAGCRLLEEIGTARRFVGGVSTDFPLSAGYAVAGVHGVTPGELLEHAAFAKHQVDIGQAENMNPFDQDQFEMSRQVALRRSFIRDVIDRNELYIVFQPIASLRTGEVYGFEALSRPANRIYHSIMDLIVDAEDTGHYPVLERLMTYNALDAYMEQPETYRDAWLFVNTSPTPALSESDYLDIRDRYFDYMRVVYEVVERTRMDPEDIARRKQLVRGTGARFALDDFGSGYSNHLALLALEPDIIKIDKGLIRNVDVDIRKQQMLEDIIGYARQGGTRVLAEGIETAGELRAVCRMGVDYAQGFFLGHPAMAFNDISQESAEIIRNMGRVEVLTPGHVTAVVIHLLALWREKYDTQTQLSGWIIFRLAMEWGFSEAEAATLSLGGVLQTMFQLRDADSDDETDISAGGAMPDYAPEAAEWVRVFLPDWPFVEALRQQSDCGSTSLPAARLLMLGKQLTEVAGTHPESLLSARFAGVLEHCGWEDGQRLKQLLETLPASLAAEEWRQEWMKQLHGLEQPAWSEGMLRMAVYLVNERDPHLLGHAAEMEKVAEMLSHMLKLSWRQSERIRLAALCRDLGLVTVPRRLFGITGRLASAELELFRAHADRSRDVLVKASLDVLAALVSATSSRTLRNTVTLEGPVEKEVNQGRAIIEVADVLVSLLQDRAWRPVMTRSQAAGTLTEMAKNGMLDILVAETVIENMDVLAEAVLAMRRTQRMPLTERTPS